MISSTAPRIADAWSLVLGGAVAAGGANLRHRTDSRALHVPTYVVALVGKYLCFAMLALAVDLVWGFAGILSLGHAAFFALGGYAMGMYLMRQIGARGVYGNANLPDFMVFLGWHELPWYWHGFEWFGFAALMVVLVPGMLALVFGWLAFRSRVTGVYLSIITQALTYALLLAFFRNDMGFGGNNGMTDFKDLLGFPVQAETTRCALLVITALFLCAQFLVARWLVTSRFGKVLIAVRDAEARTRFLGYRPESYKLVVWVLSAVMAGIGGALYVPQVGIINPSEFSPANSIEAVIWVAVGGRGTLSGAILGAVLVNLGKTYFTSALPALWLYALGAMFIFVTLFLPRGVDGPVRPARTRGDVPEPAPCAGRGARGDGMSDVSAELHDTLLYLDGVTVSFDGFRALNALSLVLEAGEMRAVIGPNGAGKTTMMDVITGKTRPDEGKVVFGKDTDLTRLDEPAIASLGIGRKFQKPTVFEPHTVWDNLLLSLAEDRRPRFTLWARETAAERRRIEEILVTTRLTDQRASAGGGICRTARSSGWRSACCWRRSRSCCWSMNRWPA